MPILCRSQKVNARKEEHPTFKAQKSWKIIFITCVNAQNKPKDLNSCVGKEFKDVIKEQSE